MNNITTVGIDLAKQVFQLHGMNKAGKCVLKKRLSREKLMECIVNLPPCVMGIEACGGAHEWARKFMRTCANKSDRKSQWVTHKKVACGENKAAVALANKNARIIGAVLSTGEAYCPSKVSEVKEEVKKVA